MKPRGVHGHLGVHRRRLPLAVEQLSSGDGNVPPIRHRPTHPYNVLYLRNGKSQEFESGGQRKVRRVNRNGNPFIPKEELEMDFVDDPLENTRLTRNHYILAGHGT